MDSVPLMTPVPAVDRDAVGQPGGAVGERVEVGVGRVGVEADGVALGVGLVGDVGAEDRRLFELATVQVNVSVSVSVPSDTVTRRCGSPGRRCRQGAADDAGGAVDRDAVGQSTGSAVRQRVAVGVVSRRRRGDTASPSVVGLVGDVGAEDGRGVASRARAAGRRPTAGRW